MTVRICKICGNGFERKLLQHIREKHNLTREEYCEKYIKSKEILSGYCKFCQKETSLKNRSHEPIEYKEFCSHSCRAFYTHNEIQSDSIRREFWANRSRETMLNMWNDETIRKRWSDMQSENRKKEFLENPDKEFGYRSKWARYNDINFRSSWEMNFYIEMFKSNIEVLYEPKRIVYNKKGNTYLVDFMIPSINFIVEIKPRKFVRDDVWEKLLAASKELKMYPIIMTEQNWDTVINIIKELNSKTTS